MRKVVAGSICFFGLLIGKVNAQCDLVITYLSVYQDCSNTTPYAQVTWTGGTPPYAVYAITGEGFPINGSTSGHNWSGGLGGGSGIAYDANFTITDALGCEATSYTSWVNHYPVSPDITFSADCIVGGILRWTGKYYTGGSVEYFGCTSTGSYSIYNITTSTLVGSGAVATDWVQLSGTNWQYPGTLPAGSYFVDIGPASGQCNNFGQVICFGPAQFIVPTNPGNCTSNLQLRAALAGALPSGALMTDHLRSAGLLPLIEPYSAGGYSYVGSASGTSVPAAMLTVTGSNAIVDWVVVEVRQPSAPYAVLHSRPALIQRDGDVIDASGSSTINTPLPPGSYRIALRHRNHLGVMSNSTALTFDPAGVLVDLTSLSTSVFGSNARVAVGSVQCLWPGDANFDGTTIYTGTSNDRDLVLTAIGGTTPTNTVTNIYSPLDINMDGVIRYTGTNNDRDIILQTIGGVVPTATRVQQWP